MVLGVRGLCALLNQCPLDLCLNTNSTKHPSYAINKYLAAFSKNTLKHSDFSTTNISLLIYTWSVLVTVWE